MSTLSCTLAKAIQKYIKDQQQLELYMCYCTNSIQTTSRIYANGKIFTHRPVPSLPPPPLKPRGLDWSVAKVLNVLSAWVRWVRDFLKIVCTALKALRLLGQESKMRCPSGPCTDSAEEFEISRPLMYRSFSKNLDRQTDSSKRKHTSAPQPSSSLHYHSSVTATWAWRLANRLHCPICQGTSQNLWLSFLERDSVSSTYLPETGFLQQL